MEIKTTILPILLYHLKVFNNKNKISKQIYEVLNINQETPSAEINGQINSNLIKRNGKTFTQCHLS